MKIDPIVESVRALVQEVRVRFNSAVVNSGDPCQPVGSIPTAPLYLEILMENEIELALSPAGAEFIAQFEGFRAAPYRCPAGKWTVGFGHRINSAEEFSAITKEEALGLLMNDAMREAAPVGRVLTRHLNPHQTDALISIAFNCGGNAIAKSGLVREINQGDWIAVSFQWARWNKSGRSESKGLTRRRIAENKLFMTGEYN